MKKRLLSLALCLTLCLGLLPPAAFATSGAGSISGGVIGGNETGGEGGGVYTPPGTPTEGGGGQYQDTRTEISCVSKPDSIGRSYDGTTDGSTIPINLTFTDGTNEIKFKEGTDFTAVKTFDSPDAGWHTVTVEITLIGDAAKQYKLKAGEEKFEIKGHINKAHPKLTVSLSKTTCTVGKKLLPLLSVSGVQENAAVTCYYTPYKTGYLEFEDSDAVPKIDENTAISEPGTYYVYAKTATTKNYEEERSTTVELTVSENTVPAVSILLPNGTDEEYDSLPAAMKAVQNGGYIRLNKDVMVDAKELDDDFTAETALALSGKSITLNLNGYVLESYDVPLTVKSGATLFVTNAGAENTETSTQVGLNLKLLVEKGGTFGCTTGKLKELQLQNAGEGEYDLRLANGEKHCTFGFFSSEDDTITVDDALKKNHAGLALHAEKTGSAVQIEKNTSINQIASGTTSFYVGACSGHEIGADNVCIYCGATVEVDNCIAHVTIQHFTWHLKTWDDIVSEIFNKLTDTYKTVTIEFLTDVKTDKALSIEHCNTYIILDLNGHTISGKLDNAPLVEVKHNYGIHRLAIQNGTIQNTGTGAALQLSSGATTLEDVDVKGDLALAYTFANSVNYTPTFLGGGSFTRICPVANDAKGKWSKKLSEMLGTGCCFLDSAGSRIDAEQSFGIGDYSEIKELVNVRVKACDHKDDNGNYTLFEDATMRYGSPAKRCKVCGNLCPHDEITAGQNPTCVACGLPIVIKTTNLLNGKAIGPWYYTGLNDAMYEILHVNKGRRPTLELLADTESDSSYEWMTNDYDGIVIDLAGHTLTLTGNQNKASYWVTIQNTSDTHAKVRGTVNVYHKDSKSKLVVLDTDNNLTIEEVKFVKDGTAELAGGSFGKITVPEDRLLASLLVSGYYFADSTSGEPAALYDANGNALTTLTNVTVKPCSHNDSELVYVPNEDGAWVWKCPCGQKTFVASVTKGEATTLYTDLQEAFKAADGGTVKLMKNERDVTVDTDEPFTLDLNGCEIYSLTVHSKITIKDSAVEKGKITERLWVSSGMTIGDLLEEGYGFQYVSSGAWCSGAEQAVGSVSVQQAPIKSVTAKNPSVTVEYGKTSEVTLTATVVPTSEEDATVSCQWYTSGGTRPPIEGETSSTYQLPADLNAGTYTYILAATKDGYEKSCDFSVTVTPLSIEGAIVTVDELTYNGEAQTPTAVTVKLGDKTLTENKDYTVTATAQTDAGSYQLTVTGKGGYAGTIENVEWKIEPMKIKGIKEVTSVSKDYDGNAGVTLPKANVTFLDDANKEISLPENAFTITNARFTTRQDGFVYEESPNAGTKEAISFTLTLTDSNYAFYVFDGETESVRSRDLSFEPNDDRFTIKQANVTSPGEITQLVFNDLAKTYTLNLAALLPELFEGCEYGDIQYQGCDYHFTDNTYLDSNNGMSVSKEGILTLPTVSAHTSNVNTQIGTITVPVVTTNYQKFEFTIKVVISARIPLNASGVTVSASEITYGQTLNESKLTATGTMKHPGTGEEVKGTFAWKNGTIKPNAGSHEAEWTFTPAEGYEEYATATGIVTVKVNPKSIAGAIVTLVDDSFEYDGTRKDPEVASVVLDGATLTPATDYGSYCDMTSDVGTHRLTVSGNNNYTGAVTVKWSITPKTVTPTITVASCTYTGNALTPTVTLKDGETVIDPSEYSVTYSNNTNAGTATVTITDKPGGNYIVSGSTTFPIAKADATCTAPTANKLTYNGGEQALLSAGSTQAGKMVYSLTEAGDYSEAIPTATNADGYVVWYKVQGDNNHNDTAPASVNVTISPATVTVKASDKSAYVGSTAPDLSKPELGKDYTVSGLFGEDALKTAPRLSYPKTPDMSKVGEAEIKIDGAEIGSNYKLEYQTGKLTITTRPSSGGSGSTGTKTDTVKNPDGSTTKTETKSDGSKTETTTATTPGGSTGSTVTKTDSKGNSKTEASAKISDKDLKDAQEKGEAVNVPVKDVEAGKDSNSATEVKIDLPRNSGKTTVEIPVDNVTSGTVAVIVHPDGTEEIAKSSKPTKDGLQVEIDGSTTVKIIDNSKDFIDTRDHWSRDEVNFVAARELFNGVGNNLFGVSQPMTRGMVNTVLARLSGVDTTPNQGQTWYEVGTEWAKKNGISDGTNPTGNVTREQLATLLYRYAGSPDVSGTLSFADAASVSDYAKNALLWANQNGIVNGVGSNTIAPKSNAERAQVAAMFARYLKNQ